MREAGNNDASSATNEMAGTSISRVMKGGVPCIEETRPMGEPKYYVAAVAGGRGRRSAVACKVVYKAIGISLLEAAAEE